MNLQRQFFRKFVEVFLRTLVKIKLHRARPTIIGITGTIGKTSTKEAVYQVLKTKWRVQRDKKSLNTDFGLLLAVLEQPSGFRSPLKWGVVLIRAMLNAFLGEKHDFIVLEYGADKPGDIEHLISVVKPDIAILTHITPVHQAHGQFKNLDAVFEEKRKLAECLNAQDKAILNFADERIKTLAGHLRAQVFWFNGKDISATQAKTTENGFSVVLHAENQKVKDAPPWRSLDAHFPVFGAYHIDLFLPALMCGVLHGIPLEEGVKALQSFHLPPGRMSLLEGKNGSGLLDSSYNASPETVKQALALLKEFPGERKIAVLGTMNELGGISVAEHQKVGEMCGSWLDMLVTVGEGAAEIARAALKNGLPEARIRVLRAAREVKAVLTPYLQKGDFVLFKGSQNNVRLERAVADLMAHPEDSQKLLCRQEKEWQEIE